MGDGRSRFFNGANLAGHRGRRHGVTGLALAAFIRAADFAATWKLTDQFLTDEHELPDKRYRHQRLGRPGNEKADRARLAMQKRAFVFLTGLNGKGSQREAETEGRYPFRRLLLNNSNCGSRKKS